MNKKICLVLMAVILTASYAHAQLNFGLRAGFNMTNMNESSDGLSPDLDMLAGFQVGVVADYAVSNNFSIQPAVLFATQGARWEIPAMDIGFQTPAINTTLRLNYIQVPINAIYRVDFGFGGLLLQAGPYLGYALSGKATARMAGISNSEDIEFGNGDEELRRLDFGVGFGAGLQLGAVQAVLGYNIGLANLSNANNVTLNNNGLALTLTYIFGR